LLASRGHPSLPLFIAMLAGISLVMASGCVFNNYIDRGIDAKMIRTKHRALAAHTLPARHALIYATVLGLVGAALLGRFTNLLTLAVALGGFVVYVALYGLAKRRSVHGTIVGAVAGAVPPVVGYTAVSGQLDAGAAIVFIILVLWQMPHFYAIAIFRLADYRAAGLPVLPVKRGIRAAKVQIVAYIAAFMFALATLSATGYVGPLYLIVMLGLATIWLRLALRGFHAPDNALWARQLFRFSLLVILTFSAMISLDALPR